MDVVIDGFKVGLYTLAALTVPLALQLVLLYYLTYALQKLIYRIIGFKAALYFTAPGTIAHELSHFLGCIFTGTPVGEVSLFNPREDPPGSGRWVLGEVVRGNASYLGSMIISIAPFFGCTFLLFLVTTFLVPGFVIPPFPFGDLAHFRLNSIPGAFSFFFSYLGTYYFYLLDFMMTLNWADWRTYVFALVTLSIAPGLSPSSTDFKHFFPALGVTALLLVPVFALFHWCGYPVVSMTQKSAGALFVDISAYLGVSMMITMGGCIVLTLMYLVKFIVEEVRKD
jgi:hypothetical protein